jgi:hypothetical protein
MKTLIISVILFFATIAFAQSSSNTLTIGPKTNVNKQLNFNRNSSTPPQIKWNEGAGALQFSNDGTNFQGFGGGSGAKNYLYNGEFRFFQRTDPNPETSRIVPDAAFGPDLWKVVSSQATVGVSRASESITASPTTKYIVKLEQLEGTPARYGTVQCLDSDRSISLRGQQVTFGFFARTDSTQITSLRAGIIEWTGNLDQPTGDIVSSWATTPTLVTGASFINTPANLTISSAFTSQSVSATLGTTFKNLCVMVWTPNAEAQNDAFYLTQAQLLPGASVVSWLNIQKTYEADLLEAQKFFEKDADVDSGLSGADIYVQSNFSTSAQFFPSIHFKVQKFLNPSCCISAQPGAGFTCNTYRDNFGGGADRSAAVSQVTNYGVLFAMTAGPAGTGSSTSFRFYCDAAMW